MSDESKWPELHCSRCNVLIRLSEPGVAISGEIEPRYICPECARSVTFKPLPESSSDGWPEVHLTRAEIETTVMSHIDNTTERYVPLQTIRERLLSNEAHEAALDAQIRTCGRASDRATEAAIIAAFEAAFPPGKTPSDNPDQTFPEVSGGER